MRGIASDWTPPAKTLQLAPGMLDDWTMLLLSEDQAQCVQFETPGGYLIKVPKPEYDRGEQPEELRDVIRAARHTKREWILVRTKRAPQEHSMWH